ncbi:MAG: magnesium/cobalt transporter CorA [Pirellulaceae bacterium]|nr:magnesium/cobalt transporter CorA [Pirellulaceae bacterium]
MRRRRRKPDPIAKVHRRSAPGSSPGEVLPDPAHPKPVIHVIGYGPDYLIDRDPATPDEAHAFVGQQTMTWINVEGLGDAQVIERFGELFGLHRLALEDTVNVHQRAKIDDFGDVLFIVVRMVNCTDRCGTEQLSMFIGPNWVLTFQEGTPGDPFDRVRQRIRESSGKMRHAGSDYLAYALLDAVIDHYYPVLEVYAERLDDLEDAVLDVRRRAVMDELHAVKSDLLILRRAIWPLRDAIALLGRDEISRVSPDTRIYLRDCYDHVVQVVELVETYRELTADLRDLYMSFLSTRINETMRVLTIISTLFIPLTFIAGIYGMNFDPHVSRWNMPELEWYYGYPLCIAVMLATSIGMLTYFYRQRWIFPSRQ